MPKRSCSLSRTIRFCFFGDCSHAAPKVVPQTKFLPAKEKSFLPNVGAKHAMSFINALVA